MSPNSKITTHTPDTTKTGLFCRVWCGNVNWVGPTARQVRSVSALCRSVSGSAVPPPDALRRRTHLSGVNSHRHTRQDKTVAPASRPPPRRRPATPSHPTAHTQRRCAPRKMQTCCGLLHMSTLNGNLNFTKRHATRVIQLLTVQTLPDGLETQFPYFSPSSLLERFRPADEFSSYLGTWETGI